MKRNLLALGLALALVASGCGSSVETSQGTQAAVDAVSYALGTLDSMPPDMSGVQKGEAPGEKITGSFTFMDYLVVLDLTIGEDCKLDGTIKLYQGETLVADLIVTDSIVTNPADPKYVGKLNFRSGACVGTPQIEPIGEDSCAGACDPAAGQFCKEDLDGAIAGNEDLAAFLESCKTDASELCYGVKDDPLCESAFDQLF